MKGGIADMSKAMVGTSNSAAYMGYRKIFKGLLREQNYFWASRIVCHILAMDLDERDKKLWRQVETVVKAFDYWDRFDYRSAWEELQGLALFFNMTEQIKNYQDNVERLAGIVEWLKPETHNRNETEEDLFWPPYFVHRPYEETPLLAYDLIRNAERKARMGWFDDAVARLCWAMEMYARFALKRRGISVSFLTDERGTTAGMFENYELLSQLGEPIGKTWKQYQHWIMEAIRLHEGNLMAHRFKPVVREEYEKIHGVLTEFIHRCDMADPYYRVSKRTLSNYPDLPKHVHGLVL